MPKVIYLTGAPAAGKSSTMKLLSAQMDLAVWEYGARLTAHCQVSRDVGSQDDLRAESSAIVTPDDVKAVDLQLLEFVAERRRTQHVMIDSHPVTKESYGFRVTAFSQERITELNPDEIWAFYADPQVTRERIRADPAGRTLPTDEQARTHTLTQMAVATTYGVMVGCPVYMFDTDRPRERLLNQLLERLT